MAVNFNLPDIDAGAEYNPVVRVWVLDELGVKQPRDFTGMSGRLQIRSGGAEGQVLADWGTSPNDLEGEISFVGNRVEISVPASKTRQLSFVEADFDILVWPGSLKDQAEKLFYGTISSFLTITELPV